VADFDQDKFLAVKQNSTAEITARIMQQACRVATAAIRITKQLVKKPLEKTLATLGIRIS